MRSCAGRCAWLQVTARLAGMLGDHMLKAGDGASLKDEARIAVQATEDAEFLLFDMRQ